MAKASKATQLARQAVRTIECPKCGAGHGERCINVNGNPIQPTHSERNDAWRHRLANNGMIKPAPEDGVIVNVDGSRFIKQSDGNWYLYLQPEDFEAMPPEVLRYWNEISSGDGAAEIPVTVRVTGKNPVPKGTDARMVLPDAPLSESEGIRYFARPGSGAQQAFIYQSRDSMPPSLRAHEDAPALGFAKALGDAWLAKSSKRDSQPVLSDELLFAKQSHQPWVPHKMQRAINDALRISRAFVFDRAASYRVGEICAYEPDLIADSLEFARPPFPKTWIELDGAAALQAMSDAGLSIYVDPDSANDERLGFLITDKGIYVAAGASDMSAAWLPFCYRPHQPMTVLQEERFCHEFGTSRVAIDRFMWGNSYDMLDPSRRRAMRAHHGMDMLFPIDVHRPGLMQPMLKGGGAGDLKMAMCAALLLIRPNMLVTKETREPGRKLHLGRPTTFIAHRVVTVKLTPDRLVRRIRAAVKEDRGRAATRWHEVRGHYVHSHKAKTSNCIHDWEAIDDTHWECRLCGGKRAWRTYPEGKGDASVGVVTKHYSVKN